MNLGTIINKNRTSRGLSMDEFAELCGLSKGYISMLENGINPRSNKPIAPTLPSLRKIACGMNIDLDELLRLLDNNQIISMDKNEGNYISVKDAAIASGINIRSIRKSKHMTQQDLANATSISLMSIRRYENGDRDPQLDTIRKIAKGLGVGINEIIGDNWPNFSQSEFKDDWSAPIDLDPMNNKLITDLLAKINQIDFTEEELRQIADFADFVHNKRFKNRDG